MYFDYHPLCLPIWQMDIDSHALKQLYKFSKNLELTISPRLTSVSLYELHTVMTQESHNQAEFRLVELSKQKDRFVQQSLEIKKVLA